MNRVPSETTMELRDVKKSYKQGTSELHVLSGVSFKIEKGEVVALVGPSGSGKSTLLHIAGLLEQPTSGDVIVNGAECGALADKVRTQLRREYIGFVYQFHHLLPELSALENVALPQMIAGARQNAANDKATDLLSKFGLSERLNHRPAQLSGGEQQRVAIARAVANQPSLLLADEPTGNLDPKTADHVYSELVSFVRDDGLAAIIATHNMALAEVMDRTFVLENGRLEEV